jgi:hypothetical protein
VNNFLSNTNKRFVKAPRFSSSCAKINYQMSHYPQEHILTRWRTYNYTDLFYSDDSEDVNPCIDGLNFTDAVLF